MPDLKMYPSGEAGAMMSDPVFGSELRQLRVRVSLADVNAGKTVLPATPGIKYRLQDFSVMSIGGALAGVTDVRVLGTRAGSSVALGVVPQAGLGQSALLRAGAATVTILADGASFTALDANTAVTVGKTGGTGTTASAVDFFLSYAVEQA